MNYQKTKVSSVEYWDYFDEQFDIELANSQGYADYELLYKRVKQDVDNQIEIA